MKIINCVRAHLFNSSSAAFTLLQEKPDKYYELINKILTVKTDAIEQKMMQKTMQPRQREMLLAKQEKYNNLIKNIDYVIKKDHLSDNGALWATPLFTHSAERLNAISRGTATNKIANNSPGGIANGGRCLTKSWFSYLMTGDREHKLAFFNPTVENASSGPVKKVSFSEQDHEEIYASPSVYSDSFESREGVIESDYHDHLAFSEYKSTPPSYINVKPTSDNAKDRNMVYANNNTEHIYDEIPLKPHMPEKK